jgi:8-oxo-dGTP pyrophosphatase MutT (NUDIX family)
VTGFRVLGDDVVHRGHRITIATRRIEGPGEQVFERDVVQHPGAVAVVPLHDDGTVTMVRQYRAALDADVVEIPAGLRDVDGEPEADTAARELAEEVGLAADHLELLATFHNSPGFCDEQVWVFLATGLRAVPDDRQGAEEAAMTVQRIPLTDALDAVTSGRITDAKTVIGLLLADRRATGPA